MIAILKYNAGNSKSVENAVRKLGFETILTDDKEILLNAEKVIIPGVGAAGAAMEYLREHELDATIQSMQQPVLGICLGLQLLCKTSDEDTTKGLGVFDVDVKRFPPQDKIPHMGWNNFESLNGALFDGVKITDDVYFVHSYYAEIGQMTSAVCQYILPFSAALQHDNFYAVQFHTEKSGRIGEQVLLNFLNL